MTARTLVVKLTPTGAVVEVDRPTIFIGRLPKVPPKLGATTTKPPKAGDK